MADNWWYLVSLCHDFVLERKLIPKLMRWLIACKQKQSVFFEMIFRSPVKCLDDIKLCFFWPAMIALVIICCSNARDNEPSMNHQTSRKKCHPSNRQCAINFLKISLHKTAPSEWWISKLCLWWVWWYPWKMMSMYKIN